MCQEKIFKYFLNIILKVSQVFGFWPYTFDFNRRLFKPSKIFLLYSILIFVAINGAYFVYFGNLYSIFLLIYKSDGARTTIFYGVVSSSATLFYVYIVQFAKLKRLNDIYVRCKCLMEELNQTIDIETIDYRKELLQFTIKAFAIPFLHIFLCLAKLTYDPISMIFGFILPDLMISVMANKFYGILLIIFVYMKRLNEKVRTFSDTVVRLRRNEKTNLEMTETFCCLSDRLNDLTAYKYQLCNVTRQLCNIFSFHVTAWILQKLFTTLMQLFLIYILVVMVVFQKLENNIHINAAVITLLQLLLNLVELSIVFKVCSDVRDEVIFRQRCV